MISGTQPMLTYAGKDLDAMSFAVNFHRWILDLFRPYLGKRLVEVGAGTGSFSEMLLDCGPEKLGLFEPSSMVEALRQKFGIIPSVDIYDTTFAASLDKVRRLRPDSILYVNVLEHIEDDEAELRAIFETLNKGGRVFVFVPALMSLMGPFDRAIGHFRRYRKSELEMKCRRAGFDLVVSKYVDVVGIMPWWIKYRLLKSDSLNAASVHAYDRFCIPFIRRAENFVTPPIGKNLLFIGEKQS